MTLNDVGNHDGVPRFFAELGRETTRLEEERPFTLDNNAQALPPLMRLRDFKLGTILSNLPSYSHSIVITLYSLSPLFPSQVNNSSSFTYPTPEFIMEIILFVSSLVLVRGKSPSSSTIETTSEGGGGERRGKKGEKERKKEESCDRRERERIEISTRKKAPTAGVE